MKVLDAIIQTTRPLDKEEVAELEGMGLKVVSALGDNRFRVRGVSDAGAGALETLRFVVSASNFERSQKLATSLRALGRRVTVAARMSTAAESPVKALVTLDPDMDEDETMTELSNVGEVLQRSGKRALLSVLPSRLDALADLQSVVAAEIEPDNRIQNNVARTLTKTAPAATSIGLDGSGEIVGVADSGLDTGVNDASMLDDFQGRVVNIRATVDKSAFGVADGADLNNHGTHVAGSILSDGSNSNGNLAGMAPAAQVTILSMGPDNGGGLSVPFDLGAGVFQDAYDDGARLHNNSWSSTGSAGAYLGYASDVDEFMRDNRDMLIVYAAGNDGDGAGSVTSPGTAKNCLTVGACESERPLPAAITINPNMQDDDFNPATPDQSVPLTWNAFGDQADDHEEIADFSGRGPADDGRIKPDIVAPGTFILSCRSSISTADVGPDGLGYFPPLTGLYANDADGVATHAEAVGRGLPGAPFYGTWDQNTPACPAGSGAACQQNYFYNSGTSMAAPITTGCAALIRQYLRERRGVVAPSGALVKALLVNGATVPAGASNAPDNDRGFGWVDMENTLAPQPTGRPAFSDDIDLAVATGDVRSFSVQLADVGHPFRVTLTWTDRQGSGLQNELYLRVITPGGATVDGDVTAFPVAQNNVQRVHIDAPAPGIYTIEVHGISVPFGIDAHLPDLRQDFALAVINGLGFSPEPSDICQVIDKSGSMGTYGYMAPVRERAKQLVDVLRINDRAGVVAFDHGTLPVHPVVPIAGFATKQAIQTAIDGLGSGGATSIGGGLQEGLAALTAGGDPGHPQALVLLSDGHENTPPWVGGGVTDSPPAWYTGSDTTEVLPTLPGGLPVYTVSLGIQSDMVLLQDIATLTGGVFHAIHSPADIAKLHEIYVHLQALTGGEEVITADSDEISGLSGSASASVSAAAGPVGTTIDVSKIVDLRNHNVDPKKIAATRYRNEHTVSVDDTMESLTLIVSSHDPHHPVSLQVVTPSGALLKPGMTGVLNHTGSSYQYFRIEDPEPGQWVMRVQAKFKEDDEPAILQAPYTYGAYGRSPLQLRVELPEKLSGARSIKLSAELDQSDKLARSLSMSAYVAHPTRSLKSLIETYHGQLADIRLNLKPDTPKLDEDLMRLAILDKRMSDLGRGSVFRSRRRQLKLSRTNNYTNTFKPSVPGLHPTSITAAGLTRKGMKYQRMRIFDILN